MRSRLVPLPSSVPPLSIPLGQGLISSSFPPVSSLLHRPSSLGVPLSSLLLSRKRPMALATFSPASPESLLGLPVLGSLGSRGSWGSLSSCIVFRCTVLDGSALRRICMCIALCFTLHWFTLLCFAWICTALHCLAFALLTFACSALRCIALASGFHGNALHCTAIVFTQFLSLLCTASH